MPVPRSSELKQLSGSPEYPDFEPWDDDDMDNFLENDSSDDDRISFIVKKR